MKRLTEKVFTGKDGKSEYSCCASVRETNNRLGELEDKLESGQLKEQETKPLTIEQLKELKEGDWVWLIDKENNSAQYAYIVQQFTKDGVHKTCQYNDTYMWDLNHRYVYEYADYGIKWFAYKNKEQAEAHAKKLQGGE